jgi:hypothetical protein
MKLVARKPVRKLIALAAVDGAAFGMTNARDVPSIGLMAGFLLLVVTVYYLINGVLSFVRLYGLSIKRRRRTAAVMTGLISGLAALQSIGELNSRDVLVLAPIMFIGYVYSSYGKGTRQDLDALQV